MCRPGNTGKGSKLVTRQAHSTSLKEDSLHALEEAGVTDSRVSSFCTFCPFGTRVLGIQLVTDTVPSSGNEEIEGMTLSWWANIGSIINVCVHQNNSTSQQEWTKGERRQAQCHRRSPLSWTLKISRRSKGQEATG